jgi:phospholipid transport system substrate-binding protein
MEETSIRRRVARSAAGFIVALALATPSMALAGKPQDFVRENQAAYGRVLRARVRDAQATRRLADSAFDYEEIAAEAVGDAAWTKSTAPERKELTSLMAELVARQYERYLSELLPYRLEYRREDGAGTGVFIVRARAISADRRRDPVEFDVKVAHRGHCIYQIVDVSLDEVSLVDTYRVEFARVLKREGWKALIGRLRREASRNG